MERAFLTMSLITEGDLVLDLGCGDGIFSGLFYSTKARNVIAIDKDLTAIKHARKYYQKDNVSFERLDIHKLERIRKKFELIVMFAVIEHFTPEEGLKVLNKIGLLLKSGGTFFGSTPIFNKHKTGISNFEHQNEFTSETDLKIFLKKSFKSVNMFHSNWDGRDECYFKCNHPIRSLKLS